MLKKIRYTVSYDDEINTNDFDSESSDEDILEECRENAFDIISAARDADLAHVTTAFV